MFKLLSGLLLAYSLLASWHVKTKLTFFKIRSSVAFLAVPNLFNIAQFFIIVSIGLLLGCVVMGFNGEVDEKLSRLQNIPAPTHRERNKQVAEMGHAIEQHFIMLLISVLCFYLSVLAFTGYSICTTVSMTRPFTVFIMATCSLIIIMGIVLRWNRRWLDYPIPTSNPKS